MLNQLEANAELADVEAKRGKSASGMACSLRAVVLLAGAVRPSELGRGAGRSLLDLPIENGRSVLGLWQQRVEGLAQALGIGALQEISSTYVSSDLTR